MWKNVTGPHLS